MLNQPSNKRRPVDALFGDDAAHTTPNYIVEPPQPANRITPPSIEPAVSSPLENAPEPLVQASEPIAITAATDERPTSFTGSEDPRFLTLSFQIERLYDDVKAQLNDSPKTSSACFDLLLQARQAYERRDYARTEFFIHATDAKLKRSAASAQASRRPIMVVLWAWELVALLIGGGIVALSYVTGLTLFGLPVAPEFIVLLRTLGWGMIGGAMGAAYNITRDVQRREFDPAYTMHYFARPLIGLLYGAVLFVLSQAGILAGNIILGDFKVGPIFLYVFVVLAGFKQEYVGEFLDNLMKALLGRTQ